MEKKRDIISKIVDLFVMSSFWSVMAVLYAMGAVATSSVANWWWGAFDVVGFVGAVGMVVLIEIAKRAPYTCELCGFTNKDRLLFIRMGALNFCSKRECWRIAERWDLRHKTRREFDRLRKHIEMERLING